MSHAKNEPHWTLIEGVNRYSANTKPCMKLWLKKLWARDDLRKHKITSYCKYWIQILGWGMIRTKPGKDSDRLIKYSSTLISGMLPVEDIRTTTPQDIANAARLTFIGGMFAPETPDSVALRIGIYCQENAEDVIKLVIALNEELRKILDRLYRTKIQGNPNAPAHAEVSWAKASDGLYFPKYEGSLSGALRAVKFGLPFRAWLQKISPEYAEFMKEFCVKATHKSLSDAVPTAMAILGPYFEQKGVKDCKRNPYAKDLAKKAIKTLISLQHTLALSKETDLYAALLKARPGGFGFLCDPGDADPDDEYAIIMALNAALFKRLNGQRDARPPAWIFCVKNSNETAVGEKNKLAAFIRAYYDSALKAFPPEERAKVSRGLVALLPWLQGPDPPTSWVEAAGEPTRDAKAFSELNRERPCGVLILIASGRVVYEAIRARPGALGGRPMKIFFQG